VKLFPEAVERIAGAGVENAIAEVRGAPSRSTVQGAIIAIVRTSRRAMKSLLTSHAVHSLPSLPRGTAAGVKSAEFGG
jgi:hypothetical protein